jgi:4-alpha-glucanotransferase
MKIERSSGILLHITSLPGNYGIGTLGDEAFRFADMLKKGEFRYWQILPIGPVSRTHGYSPYASTSTFAGNVLFINLEKLTEKDWFPKNDIPGTFEENHFVDFEKVINHKLPLLKEASRNFFSNTSNQEILEFDRFCEKSKFWLDNYALYSALAEHFSTNSWQKWESEISMQVPDAVHAMSKGLLDEITYHKFIQYLFFCQWAELKQYCNSIGIKIIGDIPIYVTMDSADTWSHRDVFQLDKKTGKPLSVSGVPPDYFSKTGQLWGNPLYRWKDESNNPNKNTASWWVKRISHLNELVDIIRIDHFRGFESYWSVPADEETAINGEWVKGPGIELFDYVKGELGDLPLIAEDLGTITPEVEKLRDDLGLPGMKILQFAFDYDNKNYYLPHNYTNPNSIVYTGTHDNNTTTGWFYGPEVDEKKRKYILEYLGSNDFSGFHWQFIRLACRSVANLVIFPAQDILGYSAEFRMNTPATLNGNWQWKLVKAGISEELMHALREMGHMYDRIRIDGPVC